MNGFSQVTKKSLPVWKNNKFDSILISKDLHCLLSIIVEFYIFAKYYGITRF